MSELSRLVVYEILQLQELSIDQIGDKEKHDITISGLENSAEKLEVYHEIYEAYNTGLALIKEKQYFEAEPIFAMLIAQEESFSLPYQIYKGHYLTLLGLNKLNDFNHQFNLAPTYIQNSKEFQELKLKVQRSDDKDHRSIFNKKITNSLVIAASILLVISGALLGNWYSERNEPKKAPAVISESSVKTKELENKRIEDELKLKTAKQAEKIKELENKNLTYEEEINKHNETNALLAAANIKLPDMISVASLDIYRQGMKDYVEGNYDRAEISLKKILTFNQNLYYTDDAHFFLIHSYLKTNKTDEAHKHVEEFLHSTDQAYLESPYLGEIMLIKANYLIGQGNKKEAEALLSKIVEKYPNEWTAQRAQSMLD
jgi:TolA-binding protein